MSDPVWYLLMILAGISVVLIGFLIWIASQPNQFRIHRSHLVGTDSATVFPLINDLKRWTDWSPYEKFDPKMTKDFSAATVGPGAWYTWSGNNQVGQGRLTIVESQPNQQVRMRLEFTRPFKCDNRVLFTLESGEGGTLVTWNMEGENTFVGKVMHVLMNMDRMVGGQFEEGLVNLDRLAQNRV